MRLTSAKVLNFRLLENAEVGVDELATLIVGRNNSGKTSFVNVFEKFFGGDECKFVLEDLPAARIAEIKQAKQWYAKFISEQRDATEAEDAEAFGQVLSQLPQIELTLTITYDEDDNLAPLSSMILDLEESCHSVIIKGVVEVAEAEKFLTDYYAASQRDAFDEDRYLRTHFTKYFKTSYYAVSAVDTTVVPRPVTREAVRSVISVKFIYAQNKLDDSGNDQTRNLSKGFEAYYRANSLDEERNQNIEGIEAALATASKDVDVNSAALYQPIFDDLRMFGVRSIAPIQEPVVVTQIDAPAVLRGSTRVEYPSSIGVRSLPEGHNGLGYSKLIFTILQIVGFHEIFKRSAPRPALQLLFIEEPEAHLHPQMQETFIGSIRAYLDSKEGWNVQVVITTHSSHIVARSGFECVRYFARAESGAKVRDLMELQAKFAAEPDGAETLKFLEQYMELRRCDMFFADKIILIEGAVERLLLPKMIRECAASLENAYISIVEVGGAYAHKFKRLLAFIDVQTLVITDLDSGSKDGRHPARKPSTEGAVTTNATLRMWLPGRKKIAELLPLDESAKIDGHVRVAYQVPESDGGPVGRSFEDAFILANADVLAKQMDKLTTRRRFESRVGKNASAEKIAANAYEIARRLGDHKTDFAFDILRLSGWTVPRYLKEGLEWLS